MYRAQMGASRPTEVFIPILLATSVSTLVGFLLTAIRQKIDLRNKILIKWLAGFIFIICGLCGGFCAIEYDRRLAISSALGNIILILLLGLVIIVAMRHKVKCYEAFVDGAKEGFGVALRILPYLWPCWRLSAFSALPAFWTHWSARLNPPVNGAELTTALPMHCLRL